MDYIDFQLVNLTSLQKELLKTVCEFYGKTQLVQFVTSREHLLKVLELLILELEYKLKNCNVRYHYILKSDISDLKYLYRQINALSR